MSWNRNYHFFLLFGDTTGQDAPWDTNVWKTAVAPAMDNLFKISSHYKKLGLGTIQYVPKPNSQYFDALKLGRLGWNDASHDKWTLATPTPARRFHHLDVWVPSRGVSGKLNSSPDIMVTLCHERDAYRLQTVAFEWFAVIAVANDIEGNIKQLVTDIAEAMGAKKLVYRERRWEEKLEDEHWHFINSIQDTTSFWIYNESRDLHKIPFDSVQFEPFWEVIEL